VSDLMVMAASINESGQQIQICPSGKASEPQGSCATPQLTRVACTGYVHCQSGQSVT